MNTPILNASLNLTQQCNLRCSYCFTGGKTDRVMSFDTAKKIVDYLFNSALEADISFFNRQERAVDISFWGGEPLLEWELLKKIALYARSTCPKEIRLTLGGTINGTLFTPDKFDFCDEVSMLFMISLDGTEETHDRHRKTATGEGSHAVIMRNIHEAVKRWPQLKVRQSSYPERVSYFYEDMKYLIEHGIKAIMFSPVYEFEWTDEHWQIWKEQSFRVVDLLAEYKSKGINISIEHFDTYAQADNSKWPCGAGRSYVGFDTDGSIWPCHRYIKFADTRPWQEKEMCIGHIDFGITKPELRQQFIDFEPKGCGNCEYLNSTPCHGGCYGVNFDLMGDMCIPNPKLCKYVHTQREVSHYLREKVGIPNITPDPLKLASCTCYNMCYLENTEQSLVEVDMSGVQCHCYNTMYNGDLDTKKVARPVMPVRVNPAEVVRRLEGVEKRFDELNEKMDLLLKKFGGG